MDASYLICAILLIFTRPMLCHADEIEVDEVLRMMREGDENIDMGPYENYVVVLGLTGAGKSTLVNVLTGDNTKLRVVQDGTNKFRFVDESNRIRPGNEETILRTLYPEVSFDNATNTAFVECPGFSDRRTIQHEIAAAHFISKVFNHAKKLKVMLVIEQNSVSSEGRRTDFVKLISYIAEMFSNLERMKHSFLIVVTKVRNSPDFTDENIVKNVKEFINNAAKEKLEEISRFENILGGDLEVVCQNKLLNAMNIMYQYACFSIARVPNVTGLVSDIPFIQVEKQKTKNCLDNLSYADGINVNLNRTLSADAISFTRENL